MPVPGALPPVQHRFIERSGARIHVAHLPGAGPPLLLLHGIGMDWRVWQAVSRRLHPHFDLYMPDLRGHGESGKPAHGYTLAHYAADVEDVLDVLGLAGAILAGSSLGAMVAVVVEAPDDIVAGRVLSDPPLTGGPVRDPATFHEILRLKHGPVNQLADFLAGSYPGMGGHTRTVMSRMWHEAADGVVIDMLARPGDYFNVDAALPAVESPALILQAEASLGGVLTDDGAAHALRLLPHGRLQKVPGSGHAVHASRPAEFTAILVDFAREVLAERTAPV